MAAGDRKGRPNAEWERPGPGKGPLEAEKGSPESQKGRPEAGKGPGRNFL